MCQDCKRDPWEYKTNVRGKEMRFKQSPTLLWFFPQFFEDPFLKGSLSFHNSTGGV